MVVSVFTSLFWSASTQVCSSAMRALASSVRAVGSADPLAELSDQDAFCQRVLAFALGYADVATRDWTRFVGARAQIDDVASWAGASG